MLGLTLLALFNLLQAILPKIESRQGFLVAFFFLDFFNGMAAAMVVPAAYSILVI